MPSCTNRVPPHDGQSTLIPIIRPALLLRRGGATSSTLSTRQHLLRCRRVGNLLASFPLSLHALHLPIAAMPRPPLTVLSYHSPSPGLVTTPDGYLTLPPAFQQQPYSDEYTFVSPHMDYSDSLPFTKRDTEIKQDFPVAIPRLKAIRSPLGYSNVKPVT